MTAPHRPERTIMEYTFKPNVPGPIDRFLATTGGAGLDYDSFCEDGHPVLKLHLVSDLAGTGDTPADKHLQVLVAQCLAPHLFGSAIAFVRASRGSDAADAFVSAMFDAYEQATKTILDIQAQGRACCEAAFRTGGREHTCRTRNAEADRD